MHRILIAALLSLVVAGCVPRCGRLTGCAHYSGWANEVRDQAARAYPYAQIAANSYMADGPFALGPDFVRVEYADNDSIDYAYAVYHRRESGVLREVIIAYRGTEFSHWGDWFQGNLTDAQRRAGEVTYERVRAATDAAVPVSVTGHSLGGGIATQVSLRHAGVKSFVFNSSPRFSADGQIPENDRVSIVEHGEVLKALRVFGREPTQTYISIGCSRRTGPFRKHFIKPLAECLTRIAAYQDPGARASLARNAIAWPARWPPVVLP